MTTVMRTTPLTLTPAQVLRDDTLFARTFLKIADKESNLIPFVHNAVQRQLAQQMGRRVLILKARQFGVSTFILGRFYRLAVTRSFRGAILSNKDDNTQMLRRIIARFHRNMPIQPRVGANSAVLTTYPDTDSEIVIATAGGRTTGRGGSLVAVHASEVAFWPDPQEIMAGIMQAGNPVLYLESTPNGAQGYFYEQCMRALDGDRDWQFFFFPWWFMGEYRRPIAQDDERDSLPWTSEEQELAEKNGLDAEQINWRRFKIRELGEKFWQEYPEDPYSCFLVSGRGFFGDIEHCWTAPEDARPVLGRRYTAGLDWGQAEDFTALSVIDTVTRQQVDLMRVNKMRWSDMRLRVRQICEFWRVAELYVEANAMGSTNIEALEDEFAQIDGLDTCIISFTTTAKNKGVLLTTYASALQNGDLRLMNLPLQKHEHNAFEARQSAVSNIWQYSAPAGGHDDTIIANMAAWGGAVGALWNGLTIADAPALLSDYRG